jgi:hemolysin III
MSGAPAPEERRQSLGEEIANAVSHGAGFVGAVVLSPMIIMHSMRYGAAAIVGATLFAVTLPLLYLTSTIYHALANNRAKRVFRVLDHGAIYLVIAGTYSPFMLGALRGPWGYTIFVIIWSLAIFGVVVKSTLGFGWEKLSTALYIGMGWLVVVGIYPLWLHVPFAGLMWLAAGGLFYTAGVGFYAAERVRYSHFVWHLFVVGGSACHVVAVMFYANA